MSEEFIPDRPFRIIGLRPTEPWDLVEAFIPGHGDDQELYVWIPGPAGPGATVMPKATADRLGYPYPAPPMTLADYRVDQAARKRAKAERAQSKKAAIDPLLADALDIMNLLVSTNLCSLDDEGNCIAHGWWTFGKSECAHARARRMLAEYAELWLSIPSPLLPEGPRGEVKRS